MISAFEHTEEALYQAYLNDPLKPLFSPPTKKEMPSLQFERCCSSRECLIWQGYLDASWTLLGSILKEFPRSNQLIFPAMFNLRHGMEVALKWHIRYAGGSIPNRVGHDLSALTEAFRQTAEGLDDENTFIIEPMISSILELSKIDPRSIAFRYSSEHDGSNIEISQGSVDIAGLYFLVGDLIVCFDALSNWIERSWDSTE